MSKDYVRGDRTLDVSVLFKGLRLTSFRVQPNLIELEFDNTGVGIDILDGEVIVTDRHGRLRRMVHWDLKAVDALRDLLDTVVTSALLGEDLELLLVFEDGKKLELSFGGTPESYHIHAHGKVYVY
ncbi:MAG: hypothetical protein AAGI17_10740 [Planctomycetota bacterium]